MQRRHFLQTIAGAAQAQAAASAPVYLADLSVCRPSTALTRKARPRKWLLLDYETESGQGVMLVAGQNTHAPEITLPLQVAGWHAISFGLRSYGAGEDETHLQVRLSSDRAFTLIKHRPEQRDRLDEYYWKTADLSGQQIVLRQYWRQLDAADPDSLANPCKGVWLAYVKLVPLNQEQVAQFTEDRKPASPHRRLFAHHDAWSYTWEFRPSTVAEIHRELEPFRESDFARIYWEAGMGDRMYYPTKLGLTAADDWIEDPYRVGDRLAAESWREFRRKGIDPFKVALEYSHALGLEFHATYRPAGFHFPVPEHEWNSGGLYDRHPEWRGRDKHGNATPRLSYAFAGVRGAALRFLGEISAYPVDGLCIAFNRRPPLIEYEAPVVESFQQQFGQDPRELADNDPRWLRHRATFVTQFMRDLRKLAGKRSLTAIVLSSERENLYFALHLESWIQEGLIDTLVPYSSVERINSAMDSWTNPADADFFFRITRGTRCRLALNLMPRLLSPEQYRTRAHRLYQAGAENLFLWDTNARYDFGPSWTALRRLGHREEVAAWAESGSPPLPRPGTKLVRLGDWNLRYATPG